MEDHWSISRQLSNQESCRRIRFFDDGNYIDTVRMSFIFFFFSLEESSRKETNDFKRKRTNNREELGQKKGLETGFR